MPRWAAFRLQAKSKTPELWKARLLLQMMQLCHGDTMVLKCAQTDCPCICHWNLQLLAHPVLVNLKTGTWTQDIIFDRSSPGTCASAQVTAQGTACMWESCCNTSLLFRVGEYCRMLACAGLDSKRCAPQQNASAVKASCRLQLDIA